MSVSDTENIAGLFSYELVHYNMHCSKTYEFQGVVEEPKL